MIDTKKNVHDNICKIFNVNSVTEFLENMDDDQFMTLLVHNDGSESEELLPVEYILYWDSDLDKDKKLISNFLLNDLNKGRYDYFKGSVNDLDAKLVFMMLETIKMPNFDEFNERFEIKFDEYNEFQSMKLKDPFDSFSEISDFMKFLDKFQIDVSEIEVIDTISEYFSDVVTYGVDTIMYREPYKQYLDTMVIDIIKTKKLPNFEIDEKLELVGKYRDKIGYLENQILLAKFAIEQKDIPGELDMTANMLISDVKKQIDELPEKYNTFKKCINEYNELYTQRVGYEFEGL